MSSAVNRRKEVARHDPSQSQVRVTCPHRRPQRDAQATGGARHDSGAASRRSGRTESPASSASRRPRCHSACYHSGSRPFPIHRGLLGRTHVRPAGGDATVRLQDRVLLAQPCESHAVAAGQSLLDSSGKSASEVLAVIRGELQASFHLQGTRDRASRRHFGRIRLAIYPMEGDSQTHPVPGTTQISGNHNREAVTRIASAAELLPAGRRCLRQGHSGDANAGRQTCRTRRDSRERPATLLSSERGQRAGRLDSTRRMDSGRANLRATPHDGGALRRRLVHTQEARSKAEGSVSFRVRVALAAPSSVCGPRGSAEARPAASRPMTSVMPAMSASRRRAVAINESMAGRPPRLNTRMTMAGLLRARSGAMRRVAPGRVPLRPDLRMPAAKDKSLTKPVAGEDVKPALCSTQEREN